MGGKKVFIEQHRPGAIHAQEDHCQACLEELREHVSCNGLSANDAEWWQCNLYFKDDLQEEILKKPLAGTIVGPTNPAALDNIHLIKTPRHVIGG